MDTPKAPSLTPSATSPLLEQALEHIRYLSVQIGGRGSCTTAERLAGEYLASQMRVAGLQSVNTEPFQAVPSTYWPFALSFGAALVGSLLALLAGKAARVEAGLLLAAVLSALGTWGMLAETEFKPSWVRWILPRVSSQNVMGSVPSSEPANRQVVLCAHIDTHRTPIFYSSERWHALFGWLISLGFLSMAAGAVLFGLGAATGWRWLHWASLLLAPVQLFALGMCLHADFTPYSPGANDNASGAAAILALAGQLAKAPLAHTTVHCVFTGCEEVGDAGMSAYLDAHANALGPDALYIILDEIGSGSLKFLTTDGLLRKHPTHPTALALALAVADAHPEYGAIQGPGLAYTDALVATLRGLPALTLCCVPPAPPPGGQLTASQASHWHQMSDTIEHIQPPDLQRAIEFTSQALRLFDQGQVKTNG